MIDNSETRDALIGSRCHTNRSRNRVGTNHSRPRYPGGQDDQHVTGEDHLMSSTSDKIKGVANEAAGNIKQGVGKVVGSDKLQAEGKAQEIKGDVQKAVGTAKDAVKDVANATAKKIDAAL